MRRLLTGVVVAVIMGVAPSLALAGSQEVAEQIARNLRDSGQMSDYRVSVTFQDGTATLRGEVASEQQVKTALKLAFQSPQVDRVANELTVVPAAAKSQQQTLAKRLQAQRLASSFSAKMAQTTSGEEPAEETPKPLAKTPSAKAPAGRVAMTQPMTRGPAAPEAAPAPMYTQAAQAGPAAARYDQPCLPNYAWPSYAAYPNYAAVTYPKQYSPTAWPYIGPFYPYPQVPLGWRKVTLEWDDGWWFLDFKDQPASCWHR